MMSMHLRVCAAVVCGALWCDVSVAGPITPPPGPVASTPGPEPRIAVNATNTPGDSSSLYRISSPGSYYLTGNIDGVAGKHGILIAADGVTLDLNGFALTGVPSGGVSDGVRIDTAVAKSVTVRNGTIRSWGDDGIDVSDSLGALATTIERVHATGNTGSGIVVGRFALVEGCIATGNGSLGIIAQRASVVSRCVASLNGGSGIEIGIASAVTACTTFDNTGIGVFAFGAGVSIIDCESYGNESGISAFVGNRVMGCTVRLNTTDGIRATSESLILDNICTSNGNVGDGANIVLSGSDSRIEGNNCVGADRGIEVTSARNIIVRNSCAGNTADWVIAANNVHGPIVDRRAAVGPAVNGFSAASTLGSTDANANYSY